MQLQQGITYYRLQMVDKDGRFTYSLIVSVVINSTSIITLYPNPVKDILHINGLDASATSILSVIDLKGNVVLKTTIEDVSYNWNVQALSKGIYNLRIHAGNLITTMKFVKE